MADGADDAQKTEDPTQKKLEDARKKGDAPKSQEVTLWFGLGGVVVTLAMLAAPIALGVSAASRPFLEQPHAMAVDGAGLMALYASLTWKLLVALAGLGLLTIVIGVLGNVVQQMPVLSAEKMKPKLSKLSPIKGAQKLFGPQGLVNFAKGLAKLALASVILAAVIWPERDMLHLLMTYDVGAVLPETQRLALRMAVCVFLAMTIIAALDYGFQRFEYSKRQRMTKQEVKDEHKQSEGDPLVKAKIRQVRQERSRQRMMAAVPDASVVIANPTHFAVALKYEHGQSGAPRCLAKGVDALALRIREVAEEHNIPVVENPPLARALYGSVEIDEEIPQTHYKAVAEVIGFILRKSRKKAAVRLGR